MSRFTLAFGIHNHQPVGNFDHVFEQAHTDAYLPFLQLIEKFPHFHLSLHQSGILWQWQKERHPEYYALVAKLVKRGQVDLLTGGFYEPILSSIPERDVRGQIAMLSDFLHRQFGVNCQGLWLTERIWEPHLPKVLAESGVRFLPVDDTHFIYAGLNHDQLTGPFVTENEGQAVTLLPIQKRLRYLIPFGTVDEVINELRRQAERDPNGVAIYADDGEKFGVWPQTHNHCYVDGWLQQFFEAVERNGDWLQVTTLTEAASRRPVGRVYLPTASYEEMLHWALPTPAFIAYEDFERWLKDQGKWNESGRFVRGGHWRGFLAKYDESNLMHKKMLWVSSQVAAFAEKYPHRKAEIAKAYDRLYASQCNCPYWHGVFGGLYLPHIRQAVYAAMIEASRICLDLGSSQIRVEEFDYDADGYPELIAQTEPITAIFKPNRGGMLLSLSLNQQGFELTDTLTRRREGYHRKLEQAITPLAGSGTASIHDLVQSKEKGLEKYLVDDWYLKRCLIDHFLSPETTLESFSRSTFTEEGDFVLEPYVYRTDRGRIIMSRDGHLHRKERTIPTRVTKSITLVPGSDRLTVEYELQTLSQGSIDVFFAVENNFSFQAGHAEDRYVMIDGRRPGRSYLDSIGEYADAHTIAMVDEWRSLAVAVTSDTPADLWQAPIFTVSLSEGGFEKVYQGTTLAHRFKLRLSSAPTRITLTVAAGPVHKVLPTVLKGVSAVTR